MNIIQQVYKANPELLDAKVSYAWDIHHNKFSKHSKAYKDAILLAESVSLKYSGDFDVYGVYGAIGRTQHSKSEIVLIALCKDVDIDRACRQYVHLVSVRNS